MKKLFLFLCLIILSCTGCKDESTSPEEKPEGSQQEIPWPSLADSPWPIYRADPQNTGRSKFEGPLSGEILYNIDAQSMVSSPVIGLNNILFFRTESAASFNAVKDYTQILWSFNRGFEEVTSPVVDKDNNAYFLTYWDLLKFNADADTIWRYPLNPESRPRSVSLTMDKSGNLYFLTSDNTLNVVDPSGVLQWKFQDNRLLPAAAHAPAFSPDGETLYLQGMTVSVLALDIKTQSVNWIFGDVPLFSAPVVDSYGNIYISPKNPDDKQFKIISINSSGHKRWERQFLSNTYHLYQSPVIDKTGNVIFGCEDTLYSFDSQGKINWKSALPSPIHSTIVDLKGNIYLTTSSGVSVFNNSGILLSRINTTESVYAILLNSDKKIIAANYNGHFIHIIGENL